MNTAEYEMLDKGIEDIESTLKERQDAYDRLTKLAEGLVR